MSNSTESDLGSSRQIRDWNRRDLDLPDLELVVSGEIRMVQWVEEEYEDEDEEVGVKPKTEI